MIVLEKNSWKLQIYLVLLLACILLYSLGELGYMHLDTVKILCLIIPIFTLYISKREFIWFHSFNIFILSFILFYFSRVYLDVFDNYDLRDITLYTWYSTSDSSVNKSLLIILISFVSVAAGFYYNSSNKIGEVFQISHKHRNIWFLFLVILLPGTLLKMTHDLSFISVNSYEDMYGSFPSSPLPYRISWFLFMMLIPLVITYKESRPLIITILIVYFLVATLDSMKGSRGALLKPLMFCLWYYYKFYSKKDLSILQIFSFFLVFIVVIQAFLVYRAKIEIDLADFMSLVPLIFIQQGVTFTILPLYFDHVSEIVNDTNIYLIYPLTSTLMRFLSTSGRNPHSFEYMSDSISLDHKIMYAINPEAYLSGRGLGSSYVLELYLFAGIISVVIGSFLLGWLIRRFEEKVYSKPQLLVFGVLWIEHIVWMSRGSFVPELMKLLSGSVIYLLFEYFVKSYKTTVSK